jgi:ABC-type Fe3+/spermidine/putrescine transport system ATPase subunit
MAMANTVNKLTEFLGVRDVSKAFNGTIALQDISFDIAAGEIVCLLGPSGCGKTTLLRIVAGLEAPDVGSVHFEGRAIDSLAPYERRFGLMFQDYALFPHKNVFENVAFGLRMKEGGAPRDQAAIDKTVREMLSLVGMADFEKRSVSELSGGEAQRVALARSLAPHPRLLMLDEPLGSLDRATRERLMVELRDILRRVGVTTLYVTHDQTEAFSVADRAIIMNVGHIEQIDPPETVYRRPASTFVAHFLGMSNMAQGKVIEQGAVETIWGALRTDTGEIAIGAAVMVLVRPEAAQPVVRGIDGDDTGCVPKDHTILRGRLVSRTFRGGRYRIRLQPDNGPALVFDLTSVEPLGASDGDPVSVVLHPAGIVLLPLDV